MMGKLQRGFTLTGLMISIALVQIVVLVSLKLQANHHAIIEDIRVVSAHNRVLTTALLFSVKQLQSAGYGIVDASDSDVIVRFSTGTSSNSAKHSILWRFREDDGGAHCRGLLETGVTIDGKDYRQLDFTRSPGGCDFTSSLASFPYDQVVGTLGVWEIDSALQDYLDDNGTLFNFQLNREECSVARLADAQTRLVATITVPNSAELHGISVASNARDVCLVNIL